MWPFASKSAAPPPAVHITHTHVYVTHHGTILPDDWRAEPARITWMRDVFRSRMGADMLAVLRNAIPRIAPGSTMEQAAINGAYASGYLLCLDTLLNLAQEKQPTPELPPATYDAPAGPTADDAAAALAGVNADDAWAPVADAHDLT